MPETCRMCGAVIPEGHDNCSTVYEQVLARDFMSPAYGEAHLLIVDSYALQHPETQGPRSNAFHLVRLCYLLEHENSPGLKTIRARLRQLEKHYPDLPFLEPPEERGDLTIMEVFAAATPDEHVERASHWAHSVWEAWSRHHEWAEKAVRFLM